MSSKYARSSKQLPLGAPGRGGVVVATRRPWSGGAPAFTTAPSATPVLCTTNKTTTTTTIPSTSSSLRRGLHASTAQRAPALSRPTIGGGMQWLPASNGRQSDSLVGNEVVVANGGPMNEPQLSQLSQGSSLSSTRTPTTSRPSPAAPPPRASAHSSASSRTTVSNDHASQQSLRFMRPQTSYGYQNKKQPPFRALSPHRCHALPPQQQRLSAPASALNRSMSPANSSFRLSSSYSVRQVRFQDSAPSAPEGWAGTEQPACSGHDDVLPDATQRYIKSLLHQELALTASIMGKQHKKFDDKLSKAHDNLAATEQSRKDLALATEQARAEIDSMIAASVATAEQSIAASAKKHKKAACDSISAALTNGVYHVEDKLSRLQGLVDKAETAANRVSTAVEQAWSQLDEMRLHLVESAMPYLELPVLQMVQNWWARRQEAVAPKNTAPVTKSQSKDSTDEQSLTLKANCDVPRLIEFDADDVTMSKSKTEKLPLRKSKRRTRETETKHECRVPKSKKTAFNVSKNSSSSTKLSSLHGRSPFKPLEMVALSEMPPIPRKKRTYEEKDQTNDKFCVTPSAKKIRQHQLSQDSSSTTPSQSSEERGFMLLSQSQSWSTAPKQRHGPPPVKRGRRRSGKSKLASYSMDDSAAAFL